MASFTGGISVSVGDAILASHPNNIAANTEFNRELADVGHDFDISTGDGYHMGDWQDTTTWKNTAEDGWIQMWINDTDSDNIHLRIKAGITYLASTPSSEADGVSIGMGD